MYMYTCYCKKREGGEGEERKGERKGERGRERKPSPLPAHHQEAFSIPASSINLELALWRRRRRRVASLSFHLLWGSELSLRKEFLGIFQKALSMLHGFFTNLISSIWEKGRKAKGAASAMAGQGSENTPPTQTISSGTPLTQTQATLPAP